MKKFEPFDTTADIGIRVFGNDLTELYENAALGMFSLILEPFEPKKTILKELEVEGESDEEVLVSLLSDLIFLLETEGFLFHTIVGHELSMKHYRFELFGEKYLPSKHSFLAQIKAVTYHNLEIRKDKILSCEIVFDV